MEASRNTEANVAEIASNVQEAVAQAIQRHNQNSSYDEIRRARKSDEMVAWIASNVQQTVDDFIDQRMTPVTADMLQNSRKLSRSIDEHLRRTSHQPLHYDAESFDDDGNVVNVNRELESMRGMIRLQEESLNGLASKVHELGLGLNGVETVDDSLTLSQTTHGSSRGSRHAQVCFERMDEHNRKIEAVTATLGEFVDRLSVSEERRLDKENQHIRSNKRDYKPSGAAPAELNTQSQMLNTSTKSRDDADKAGVRWHRGTEEAQLSSSSVCDSTRRVNFTTAEREEMGGRGAFEREHRSRQEERRTHKHRESTRSNQSADGKSTRDRMKRSRKKTN